MNTFQLNLGKPLCFFDLETTGVNVGTDRIVEISILKANPDGSEQIYTRRINPTVPIPAQVSEIHGIYDKDVIDEPTFKELSHEIAAFIGHSDLAGYNSIKFDIPLLVEEFLRTGIDFEIKNRRLIDVQNIFHKMEPRTLVAAYRFYCGKPLEDAHSAEADTRATYEVLKAQIQRYENEPYTDKKGNVSFPVQNNMEALSQFSVLFQTADLAGHIGYDNQGREIFKFGKYKDRLVEEIMSIEPSYYDWMMKADFPLYTKKILTNIRLRTKF